MTILEDEDDERMTSGGMSADNALSFLMLGVPDSPDLLRAVGVVALRHAHLDYTLKMTIKTLAGVSVQEAIDATEYQNSSVLRDRIRRLARTALGEGAALLKLQALLTRCGRATDRRNDLMHNIWCHELDGPHLVKRANKLEALPTVTDLEGLAAEIQSVYHELNTARLEGFIHDAIKSKADPSEA